MKSTDDYIGTCVGNYLRGEKIASGGFASVYYGRHVFLEKHLVAIKVLHIAHLASEEKRARFLQEARLLVQMNHPHCLRVCDAGLIQNLPYIISEYAEGGSLHDKLRSRNYSAFSVDETLVMLSQIGDALQYIHEKRIIHRDLKPENILFNSKDEALLADFGIAVVLQATSVEAVDKIGTPAYMAPEQFYGQVSRRSDQYALACIAYELLTGRQPFDASDWVAWGYQHTTVRPRPLSDYNPLIPDYINQAVLRAMSKQREDRFPNIAAFINTLCNVPLKRANSLFHSGAFQKSTYFFMQAIHNNPQCSEAYVGLGQALYQIGKYKEALKNYRQAVCINPKDINAHLGKIRTYVALKDNAPALAACEKALSLHPDCIAIREERSNILSKMQNN